MLRLQDLCSRPHHLLVYALARIPGLGGHQASMLVRESGLPPTTRVGALRA